MSKILEKSTVLFILMTIVVLSQNTNNHSMGDSPKKTWRVTNNAPIAGPKEFKSVVAILNSNTLAVLCTGTLISSRTILTAAHCFKKIPYSRMSNSDYLRWRIAVKLNGAKRHDSGVKRILLHPDYELHDWTEKVDIALLILMDEVKRSEFVDFVRLPRRGQVFTPPYPGIIAGYGRVDWTTIADGQLRKGTAEVLPSWAGHAICYMPRKDYKDPKVFCAAADPNLVSLGDSGGPLFVGMRDSLGQTYMLQVGIFSSFYKRIGSPARYMNVHYYVDWIWANDRAVTLPNRLSMLQHCLIAVVIGVFANKNM